MVMPLPFSMMPTMRSPGTAPAGPKCTSTLPERPRMGSGSGPSSISAAPSSSSAERDLPGILKTMPEALRMLNQPSSPVIFTVTRSS